jgi:type IV pilus assembly protein PilA
MAPNAPYYPQPQQPKSGFPVWAIVLIIVLLLVVAIVGILAVLAVTGVRRYTMLAKTAEAMSSVNAMAHEAEVAYTENGAVCDSASAPVPAAISQVSGKKYMSSTSDWEADKAKNAGFACLKFEMSVPQYYQYDYKKTATGFTALAHGDLNGDSVTSEFSLSGHTSGTSGLTLDTSVKQTNPTE